MLADRLATAVRGGAEGFLIDSPVLPDEIEALPAVLEQAGSPLSGLLCTHGDWDHLLARAAFAEVSLGVGQATFERLRTDDALRSASCGSSTRNGTSTVVRRWT